MAALVAENDIDSFIKNQKTKLQYERETLGNHETRRRWDKSPIQDNRFAEEKQNKSRSPRRRPKTPAETGLPLGKHEEERRKLNDERKKEYNERISKKRQEEENRRGGPAGLPPRPPSQGFLSKIGQKDQEQKKLKEERQQEYAKYIAEQKIRTKGEVSQGAEEYVSTIPGIREHQSAEIVKMKQRNEEYNVFLREKQEKEKNRFADKKPKHGQPRPPPSQKNKEGIFASIPGLSYSDSPQIRKEIERNKEYKEFLKEKTLRGRGPGNVEGAPETRRGGIQSPSYEDILDQKRREEAKYRRNDPEYGNPQELPEKVADREYNARNAKLRDYPMGILEDDDWLNPANQRRAGEYADLREGRRAEVGQQQDDEKVDHSDKENMARTDAPYYATLPVGRSGIIGQEPRGSAKRRKQEEYRKDLEQQIRKNDAAKRREKLQDLGHLGAGPTEISPRREYRGADYQTKFDLQQREPEGRSILDAERDFDEGGFRSGRHRRREAPNSGILDGGFDQLIEPRRNVGGLQPPPGLLYEPSTYVTAGRSGPTGGFGGPSGPYSSVDEAYLYYGMKDPLQPETSGPTTHSGQQDQRVSFAPDAFQSPTPRVTFDEPVSARRVRDRSRDRISPYQFNSDEDGGRKSRQDQQSYQADLDRQIYERRQKQMREKQANEQYERKLEEDMKNYNPFGRGGGGAPIRDSGGNAIADLRSLKRGVEGGDTYRQYESPSRMSPISRGGSPRDDLIKAPPPQTNFTGETTYARGGHGIFGMPKTETEKTQMEKYKDELRKQIEEKKMKEKMEKEKEMLEEQRENERLEEQRKKMQSEFDDEVKKARAKEEDARRQNEAIKEQAEQRKRENERKKKEQDEQRQQQLREEEENRRQQKQREQELQQRLASPPVPAVRNRDNMTKDESAEERKNSPPISPKRKQDSSPKPGPSNVTRREIPRTPDHRFDPPERTNSSEVLGELARMRKQLETERLRVQNALENSKNEPEVFDPRMVQRPPPRDIVVLERDRDNRATLPPRGGRSDSANQRNLQTFNELKYHGNSDSRRQFRSLFPEAPTSGSALEAQQDALLRQQEDGLRHISDKATKGRPRYKKKGLFEKTTPTSQPKDPGYGRAETVSPRSLLVSNSAFIDVDGVNHFPDDFEDMQFRNASARQRRRDRYPLSPRPESQPYNPLGSQTSLDVDRIQRKNEERLRNLRSVSRNDGVSLADPDDILDQFMAKQTYRNRPPSGQTLQDESWLNPGSKHI